IFQLSTSWQADYPIFWGEADMARPGGCIDRARMTQSGHRATFFVATHATDPLQPAIVLRDPGLGFSPHEAARFHYSPRDQPAAPSDRHMPRKWPSGLTIASKAVGAAAEKFTDASLRMLLEGSAFGAVGEIAGSAAGAAVAAIIEELAKQNSEIEKSSTAY